MSTTTTQRLSSLLVATLFIVVLALMATFGVRSADAAQPVGECPASYEPGLVTVKFVLKGANLDEPDPSMDPNGDGPASNLPLVTHEEFPFIHPMQAPSHPRKEPAYEPLGTITIYNTLPL